MICYCEILPIHGGITALESSRQSEPWAKLGRGLLIRAAVSIRLISLHLVTNLGSPGGSRRLTVQTSRKIRLINEEELGGIELYRTISDDGSALNPVNIPKEVILRMHRLMLLGRAFDERATTLSSVREIGTYAPHRGQEGAQVASILALKESDWYVPMYRDGAGMIAKGYAPEKLFQYWGGDERGLSPPPGLRMLPFGIPVSTQIPHAAGLAMVEKWNKSGSLVFTMTGDGGTSRGDFHEALNIAGVYGLPFILGVENNQYAISVPRSAQTHSGTIAQKALAYGVDGMYVDGNDPLASYSATSYAAELARSGRPVLIEYVTYRMSYHTTAELVSFKLQPQEELRLWQTKDPIARLEKYMLKEKLISPEEIERARAEVREEIRVAVEKFRAIPAPEPEDIFSYMYSSLTYPLAEQMEEAFGRYPSVKEESAVQPPQGGSLKELNIRNALNLAIKQEMERDPRIVVYGEDVARNGGVFQVTRGLSEEFGERVFDTPLSEAAIAGIFVGLAIGGRIPVAEFQFEGFTLAAYDQIFSHIARMRNRTRGRYALRGVIRFPYGGGLHSLEHHSDSPEAYFVHTPGLKVVVPSNPYDAKGLFAASVRDDNPVIFMEPKKHYDSPRENVPEGEYTVPLGKARVVKEGNDVTIVTYGAMVYPVMEAAQSFQAEVIDLRTISPIDFRAVVSSVEKTGRLIVVHEAPRTAGVGAEISAYVAQKAMLSLKAPIIRVTGYDIVDPLAKLEDNYTVNAQRIAKAIRNSLSY